MGRCSHVHEGGSVGALRNPTRQQACNGIKNNAKLEQLYCHISSAHNVVPTASHMHIPAYDTTALGLSDAAPDTKTNSPNMDSNSDVFPVLRNMCCSRGFQRAVPEMLFGTAQYNQCPVSLFFVTCCRSTSFVSIAQSCGPERCVSPAAHLCAGAGFTAVEHRARGSAGGVWAGGHMTDTEPPEKLHTANMQGGVVHPLGG